MTRTGNLIAGALVFALVAAGVLVWSDFLELSSISDHPSSSISSPANSDVELSNRMVQLATPGGLIATFSDADSALWTVTDAHRIERFRLEGTAQAFARLSSTLPLDPENRLSGLQLKLPLSWAQKANGKKIEVGVVARQPQTNAASDISLLYATLQAGNSGWHTLPLGPSFSALKFTFAVPAVEAGYTAQPVIVVRSDATGGDRAVEIVGIYVKPLTN